VGPPAKTEHFPAGFILVEILGLEPGFGILEGLASADRLLARRGEDLASSGPWDAR
jgi:hypothetical protein